MTNEEILREFAALPPEGQRLVAEFIAFVRQRYASSPAAEQPEGVELGAESFIGLWRDREDLQDSSAWVRGIRSASG